MGGVRVPPSSELLRSPLQIDVCPSRCHVPHCRKPFRAKVSGRDLCVISECSSRLMSLQHCRCLGDVCPSRCHVPHCRKPFRAKVSGRDFCVISVCSSTYELTAYHCRCLADVYPSRCHVPHTAVSHFGRRSAVITFNMCDF